MSELRQIKGWIAMTEKLLEINKLSTAFKFEGKFLPVTRGVSFTLYKGEILGLVGESGSGKSVTSKSIMRLLPESSSRVLDGEILFNGEDILKKKKKDMLDIRGNKISMIFQEPMTSLNPVYTCGNQIVEAIKLHQGLDDKKAWEKGIEMLKLVGIPMPEVRMKNYPHELSGGMRQRIMIAMALSCNPELLIADEPTTALDPTIQAQIIELIKKLQKDTGMSVLYITHDLGVVAETCDRVVVLYAGVVMEIANVKELFYNPLHPYTKGLLASMPRLEGDGKRLNSIEGAVPHFTEMPQGCPFNPRCPHAVDKCKNELPPIWGNEEHQVRCWLECSHDNDRI